MNFPKALRVLLASIAYATTAAADNTCTEGSSESCTTVSVPPRNRVACNELRQKTYRTARVLCGSDVLSYGWEAYNARCATLTPQYIIQPTTVEDIQNAIAFAKKYNIEVSVRGVGHSYTCQSFKENSLNIDLRTMGSDVTFEKRGDDMYMHAKPGTMFFHALKGLADNNLADKYHFIHGTCSSVGVMGYHLHGGWCVYDTKWANESIAELDVVTADGSNVQISASSTGKEKDLWDAMRVVGSSFGIVTQLTVELLKGPEPKRYPFFVENSFDDLLSKLPHELDFGWVYLMRWDQSMAEAPVMETLGSNWIIGFVVLSEDDEASSLKKIHSWLSANKITTVPFDWKKKASGIPILPEGFKEEFGSGDVGSWDHHRYPVEDSGAFSRVFPIDEIKSRAKLLQSFLEPHASSCRYQLTLKGETKPGDTNPLLTLECTTPESIAELKAFVKENEVFLKANEPGSAYFNMPLDSATREYCPAFWPQYDKLAAIKNVWDPEDFFNIYDGIHPSSDKKWKCE